MSKRKVELVSDFHANIDLSIYAQEVRDYVCDQLYDRLEDLRDHELEVTDEKDGTITVSLPIIDLIYKIVDEKVGDMEWEIRHGQRDDEDETE